MKGRLKVVALVCIFAVLALPAFAFATGTPTGTQTRSSIRVIWTASAPLKLAGAKISVTGAGTKGAVVGASTATSNTAIASFGGLTDGLKTIVATGKNKSTGAIITESWTVTISEAPKFAPTSAVWPGNLSSRTTTPTSVYAFVTDNSGVAAATAVCNGVSITPSISSSRVTASFPTSGALSPYVVGSNDVTITATDAAANTVTKHWKFFISATSAAQCFGCHAASAANCYGPTLTASGHNTTENGLIGGKSKFDGTQGVTLTWISNADFTVTNINTASATDPNAAISVAPGSSFTNGQTGTVNSTWSLPTKAVFWPATNDGVQDAPSTAIKGLGWGSVITCQDCHTAYNANGPHGSTVNAGLDTNYPADYAMAGLTKYVTSGDNMVAGTHTPGVHSASGIFTAAGADPHPDYAGAFSSKSNWSDGTTGSGAVICAKCHRLEQTVAAGWSLGGVAQAYPVVVGANTAHNSHHQDTTDGTNQCVSCHVAVTHGWKAPRLLVDVPEFEGTEYVSDKAVEEMQSISALNNHPLVPADGTLAYGNNGTAFTATVPNTSLAGTVLWDEGQCEACGDHAGNTITTNASVGGNQQSNSAVPVRIAF
jgi:hypothetical protein